MSVLSRCLFLPVIVVFSGCITTSIEPESSACPGARYADAVDSPYAIPFPVGSAVATGLANCSRSYHSRGLPDQFATDFDLPEGTHFLAARGGVVSFVQEDQPSYGGGDSQILRGNGVFVDHGDGTTALYLHSPMNGVWVEVGDTVAVGDTLGLVGASGLAGYPHLHFIVVTGAVDYPYTGVPVSFRNPEPRDVPLRSFARYNVGPVGGM